MSFDEKNYSNCKKRNREQLDSASSVDSIQSPVYKMQAQEEGAVQAVQAVGLQGDGTRNTQHCPQTTVQQSADKNKERESQNISNAMLLSELRKIQQGQADLSVNFSNQLKDLRNEIITTVDKKITTFKENIEANISKLQTDINDVHVRLLSIEKSNQAGNNMNTDLFPKLILKKLPYTPTPESETADAIKGSIMEMMRSVDIQINKEDIIHVERTRTGPQLKPVVITLKNESTKANIMRVKSRLRTSDSYRSVYIEPFKTRNERAVEANIRKIAGAIPGIEFRSGRVREDKKSNTSAGIKNNPGATPKNNNPRNE